MGRAVWDCVLSRFPVALALTLGLWGLQPSLPLWAQTPGVSEPVDPAVYLDEYDNLEVHPEGLYLLRREGARVTATFTSVGSAVKYAARQKPEVLFTVPIGFRPQEQETREVDGWPLSDGVLDPAILIPVRFRVQVAPTGEVRYLDGPELEEVGHLAYVMVATWTPPDFLGRYDDQAAHHGGAYSLRRTGSQVTAQLRTTRSPVQHFARQAPEVLFTVPAGYRPAHEVQVEVTALQPVDEAGTFRAELPATRSFRLKVAPNGEVRYVDDAGVDEVGYLAYEAEVMAHNRPVSLPAASRTGRGCGPV